MGNKILLTGNNHILIEELNERLPRNYDVRICKVSKTELSQMLLSYTPSVIIVCLEREENGELMLYQHFFAQNSNITMTPLLVAGSKEDAERFRSYIDETTTVYVYRPLSYEKVFNGLEVALEKINNEECRVEAANISTEPLKEPPKEERKQILVVDDDSNMLKAIKNLLSEQYKIALASSGRIAIKYLESHSCDAILLDYMMPDQDGPAVLNIIRNMPERSGIPVIFLTGVDNADMVKQCLLLKPQGYLLKPVRKDKLFATLEAVLTKEGGAL